MTSAEPVHPRGGPAAVRPPLPRPSGALRDVVHGMRGIGDGLPQGDGVAVFNRVYLSVTQELQRRLETGWFGDPRAAEELGARFAGRYLAAVRAQHAGAPTPACWRPLFQFRRHPHVRPLQFALAGINAHVGHDLPLALLATCRARRAEPADLEGDFERVGDLLTLLEERVREELMPGPDLLDVADPLTHLVGSWSLRMARSGAWMAFRTLWGLRQLPELAEEFTEGLDASVGMAGRCLLTPLAWG
ncbi:hypothetical protein K378_04337 [Streptomyces sp. Amel2xB2]|uniref:DUF5995 family protein n=1 Tax=Streptomyces sp. Amel2xB2 TaxID=1305829 RepID=UPI000DBFA775|nr:DUF5995 family protein [Streptomyces sp. Amel2xB2]RAJ60524.1 hypothetical protein K378_04337 [Streptomyces sp. Amel2xB2]